MNAGEGQAPPLVCGWTGFYAFATARGRAVICLAHVTNRMGTIEGDFEKGDANGTADALAVVSRMIAVLG